MKSALLLSLILILTPAAFKAETSDDELDDNLESSEDGSDEEINSYRLCKRELLFAYGVENPGYIKAPPMLCQHRTEESCCSRTAESQLLERWVNVNRVLLVQNIDGYMHLLKGLFDYYEDLILFAKYVHMNPHSGQKCMESSRFLIMNYLKKDDILKFVENLNISFDFLKNSRKGFYCSICDVNYQHFFDTEAKKIIFSTDFCQGLVENTIEAGYERVNQILPLFENINVLMTCNKDEEEENIGSSESEVQFTIDDDDLKQLNDCYSLFSELIKPDLYMNTCVHYCRDYKFSSASPIFEGSLAKLSFLYDKILQKGFTMTDPVFALKDEDSSFVQEDGTEITNYIRKEYDFTAAKDMYFHSEFKVENINSFESIFEDIGIDPIQKSNDSKFLFGTEDYLEDLKPNPFAKAEVFGVMTLALFWFLSVA